VRNCDLSDATLVLLGHGSTQNADSAAPAFQHAAGLRRRQIFRDVREAFWKQEPHIKKVLPELTTPRIFILPLFISEGYFSTEIIPRELGLVPGETVRAGQGPAVTYCQPVGTHDRMTAVLVARARGVVARFPFPRAPKPAETTLYIAGHGTGLNENSRKAIERQVGLIRALNEFAAVHAVFMEEPPRIAQCYELAHTRNIVVVPFFISDGLHAQEDIPVLLGEPERWVRERLAAGQPTWHNPTERHDNLLWYAPAVGTAPEMADVILDRVLESVARNQS